MDNNRTFYKKYDMYVMPSQRKFRRVNRLNNYVNQWHLKVSDDALYQSLDVEEVDCVDIVIPKDRLEELEAILEWYEGKEHRVKHNEEIVQMLRRDERVRIENPAVQKAYQKYLMLLELARK